MHNIVERCVKILAYYDKNCRRRNILKTVDRQTDRQTDRMTELQARRLTIRVA